MTATRARTRGGAALLFSNPVAEVAARMRREGSAGLAVERRMVRAILAAGHPLSAHHLDALGLEAPDGAPPRRHGVVGLVLGRGPGGDPFAWVDRLTARPSERWTGRAGLPFEPLDLLGVLLRLLGARSADELLRQLPEAKAFTIEDELEQEITGPSMTIAGALAVLDAAGGGRRPELEAVASFVQLEAGVKPSGAGDQRLALGRVEGEREKLAAFQRECGRGSLCLVAPDTILDERELFRSFERVWRVEDLDRLGGRLEAAGLLEDFARPEPLSRRQLLRVEAILARLGRQDFLVRRALDLARRLEAAADEVGFGRDVSAARRRWALSRATQPLRLDAVLEAPGPVEAAEATLARAEAAPEVASNEELCRAAIDLAAACYVAYDFERMEVVLRPWRERLAEDPRLVPAWLRVRVLGNLARALVPRAEAGDDEWLTLLTGALELQLLADPSQLTLTRGFLVGALLAHDRLDEAGEQLAAAESDLLRTDYADNLALWFLRFDRADLARRRGEVWDDPEMEHDGLVREGQFGRALGYYFQATARQAGRERTDAAERFDRAAAAFAAGAPPESSGQWVFTHLCRLGAAERRGDAKAWRAARADLEAFLARDHAARIAAWYGERLGALPLDLEPDLDFEGTGATAPAPALEALFLRDPYFLGR